VKKFNFRFAALFGLYLLTFTFFTCKPEFTRKQEIRAVWVSRWEYTKNLPENTIQNQQLKIQEVMQKSQAARLNMVLFQVRGQGDAYYRSQYEPWAKELTGQLGGDPGYDPLELAIQEAHARGLEIHAWFNTFTCWRGTEPPEPTTPEHIFYQHPEWFCVDKDGQRMPLSEHYIFLSPGIPAVREYIQKVALDLVQNYDLDGIHFDYIRYPENARKLGFSHDSISVQRFNSMDGNPNQLTWEDWQREQITQFVSSFYDAATRIKPMLKVSAAVFGRYDLSAASSFHSVFQDSHHWLIEGKIDFIVPMIYWHRAHPTAPFGETVTDWINSNTSNRPIIPGIGAYRQLSADWPADEVKKQVKFVRKVGAIGMAFFSFTAMDQLWQKNRLKGLTTLANLPPMRWKDNIPPSAPQDLQREKVNAREVVLTWVPPLTAMDGDGAAYYNIYRATTPEFDPSDARNLYAITTDHEPVFADRHVKPGKTYYYAISAMDKGHNESQLSEIIKVEILPMIAGGDQ